MNDHAALKAQTLLAVENVLRSSAWYADPLGLRPSSMTVEETHENTHNRLFHGEELILQLHSWDDEGHPNCESTLNFDPTFYR